MATLILSFVPTAVTRARGRWLNAPLSFALTNIGLLSTLPRQEIAQTSIEDRGFIAVMENTAEMF